MAQVKSRAAGRNADLRAALRAQWPGTKFAVRNGREGAALVSWVDGPREAQVIEVLNAVPSDVDGYPWAFAAKHRVTAATVAISYLRARAAGEWFYLEKGYPGEEDLRGALSSWRLLWENVDQEAVEETERTQAQVLCRIAGVDPATLTGHDDQRRAVRALAAALFHHGDVVDAILLDLGDGPATTRHAIAIGT